MIWWRGDLPGGLPGGAGDLVTGVPPPRPIQLLANSSGISMASALIQPYI